MKKLEFLYVIKNTSASLSQIWYRDKYGQARFMELSGLWTNKDAIELLTEIERMFLSHES